MLFTMLVFTSSSLSKSRWRKEMATSLHDKIDHVVAISGILHPLFRVKEILWSTVSYYLPRSFCNCDKLASFRGQLIVWKVSCRTFIFEARDMRWTKLEGIRHRLVKRQWCSWLLSFMASCTAMTGKTIFKESQFETPDDAGDLRWTISF